MLEPIRDFVLVELEAEPERTPGGVLLPQTMEARNQSRAQWGLVAAVGPGRTTRTGVQIPVEVQPGDRVCFGRFAGTEMVVENPRARAQCVLIREGEVLVRNSPHSREKGRSKLLPDEEP